MPCYRVPVRYFTNGIIAERQGPIIDAPSPAEAVTKAEFIFGTRREFAGIGEPVLLHEDKRHGRVDEHRIVVRPLPPMTPLSESLYRMVVQIRARRRSGVA